jgi:predicted phosphate transport protein (TIGR00153 family)
MPREENFFVQFTAIADQIVLAAHEFRKMLTDLPNVGRYCSSLKDIEHRGDDITHLTKDLLHKTFITPMDREDIHRLISRLDDVLDFIEAAGQRVGLYGITSVPKEFFSLADIIVESCEHVRRAVQGLQDLKHPEGIGRTCVEINRLENDADHVLRNAIAKLFREETDVRQLIKLKEIFELLETVTDRCEDVANVIDGIVLEYA